MHKFIHQSMFKLQTIIFVFLIICWVEQLNIWYQYKGPHWRQRTHHMLNIIRYSGWVDVSVSGGVAADTRLGKLVSLQLQPSALASHPQLSWRLFLKITKCTPHPHPHHQKVSDLNLSVDCSVSAQLLKPTFLRLQYKNWLYLQFKYTRKIRQRGKYREYTIK